MQTPFDQMKKEEAEETERELLRSFAAVQKNAAPLDLSRGKPGQDQLRLSHGLFTVLTPESDMLSEEGWDIRNYGCLTGLTEMKRVFSSMLSAETEDILLFGASSLAIMYDLISKAMVHGIGGETPWGKLSKVRFLCPVPGYDRHFAITECFGIEMIPVPIDEDGPDMDLVEKAVTDSCVKGIWCVPKYGNPSGITYSENVVRRFAALNPAAKDFRIFWDNAYCIHDFDTLHPTKLANLFSLSKENGTEDRIYEFASFSKITFPGASVAALHTSEANRKDILSVMKNQIIGYDKIAQMAHARFFPTPESLRLHMQKHADLLKPKFDLVCRVLAEELNGLSVATWTDSAGGYFLLVRLTQGSAKEVVSLARDLSLKITEAGATHPYHFDPEDSYLRIAPSAVSIEELEEAMHRFALCVKLSAIRSRLRSIHESFER